MPRFHVPSDALERMPVRLRGAQLRYLRHVLRLGAGDRIELFDGEGRAFAAEIVSVAPSAAEVVLLDPVRSDRESPLLLTLAVAISKGAKLDWVVEKATELGISRIIPFLSERTVPERTGSPRRVERWRRIATAAAAQCGRVQCPTVSEVSSFAEVLAAAAGHDLALLFWEGGGKRLADVRTPRRRLLVVTGPEGGFSAREAAAAEQSGFTRVGLGPRILRAESAAVTAAAICQFLWGDLGAPARARD